MEQLFMQYLTLSEKMRVGYKASLGKSLGTPFVKNSVVLPQLLQVIYNNVAGTKSQIENQEFMDFVPGYRLIHLEEYERSLSLQSKVFNSSSKLDLLPVLQNYSSDFVSIEKDTGAIYFVYHDDDVAYKTYESGMDFLMTLIRFYLENVFFVDEDGFLDYDEDKEFDVARKLNPTIEYWVEMDV